MRITAWGNDSGSKYWRLIDPFKYLRRKKISAFVSEGGINSVEAQWADINIIQSCTDKDGIAYLYQLQKEEGKKLVVECDDFIELNPHSPFKEDHDRFDAEFVIKRTMQVADLITTTTEYLADKLKEINPNVEILPNYMDFERWEQPILKNTTNKIRIGWAGSITHLEDMKILVEPLHRIYQEHKNIQLVIIGDPRVAKLFEGIPTDVMLGVPFDAWPAKLHSLRLDIGLAPLEDNEFNRCKSNIKWMEYSIAGVPGVYSPIVYTFSERVHFDGLYGQTAETPEQWYRNIKNYIISENLRHDIASRARACVKTGYGLKNNIKKWIRAYRKLLK